MSFSQRPDRFFEFFTTSGGYVVVECSGCGGESDLMSPETTAADMMIYQREHILRSHGGRDFSDRPAPNHRDKDEPQNEWLPSQWQYVMVGDRVRLGQEEATVAAGGVGVWNVDTSNKWEPRPWSHTEVNVRLQGEYVPNEPLIFPPTGDVEILCNEDRAAILGLQGQFNAKSHAEQREAWAKWNLTPTENTPAPLDPVKQRADFRAHMMKAARAREEIERFNLSKESE